jgi:hypothetical protein
MKGPLGSWGLKGILGQRRMTINDDRSLASVLPELDGLGVAKAVDTASNKRATRFLGVEE